jgi:hypothetical protein
MSYVLLYRLLLDSVTLHNIYRNQLKVKIHLEITTRYVMIRFRNYIKTHLTKCTGEISLIYWAAKFPSFPSTTNDSLHTPVAYADTSYQNHPQEHK